MSTKFSEASQLILKNWDIVKEIQKTEVELGIQLREFLYSFESRLSKCEWWNEKWQFVQHRDDQIYITHRDLRRGDDIEIWIGLERFKAEAIFGNEKPPQLYVWLGGKHDRILAALRSSLGEDTHIIGDINTKWNNSYIVTHWLRKCLPEELESFDDVISEPIIEFFSCYSERVGVISSVLAQIE